MAESNKSASERAGLGFIRRNLDTISNMLGISIDGVTLQQIMGRQAKTPSAPEIVASKLVDEGLFEKIARYMEVVGGYTGEQYANNLRELHKALMRIHPDYGIGFRGMLFAGLEEKQALSRIDTIYSQAQAASGLSDPKKQVFLETSPDSIIQDAIGKAQRVKKEAQQSGTSVEEAAQVVAQQMIDNHEIPPTLAISTKRFQKAALNKATELISKGKESLVGEGHERPEEKQSSVQTRWVVFILAFFALIFLIAALGQPKERSKPIEMLKNKISNTYFQ
jgi:hypothetical protein